MFLMKENPDLGSFVKSVVIKNDVKLNPDIFAL